LAVRYRDIILAVIVLSALFLCIVAFGVNEPIVQTTDTHQVQNSVSNFKGVTLTIGDVTIDDSLGIRTLTLGSTNGVKIGATGNKIGFLGAAPIVRPVGTTDLRTALINLGLYSSGGATPLNLNGGAFTAATGVFSGNVTIGGTLGLTGTLSLTGNETIGGTLGVTGLSTLGSLSVTNGTTLNTATVNGTLGVTGVFTGTTAVFSSAKVGNVTFDTSAAGSGSIAKFPTGTSTTVTPIASTSHLFLNSLSTGGAFSATQPTFADLASTPTTLAGYGITDAQLHDTDLDAVAALSTQAFGLGMLEKSSKTAEQTYLGLAIGSNIEAWSANLDGWATKTPYLGAVAVSSGKTFSVTESIALTGSTGNTGLNIGAGGILGPNAFTSTAFVPQTTTVNGHQLSSNGIVTPSDLGLVVGNQVEAWSPNLDAWALKTPYAGDLHVTTGKIFNVVVNSGVGNMSIVGNSGANLQIGNGGTLGVNAYTSTPFVQTGVSIATGPLSVGHSLPASGTIVISQSDMGLTIGTNVEAHNAKLTDISANKTLPAGTVTLADTTSAQTLTNKTEISPIIQTPTINTINSASGSDLALNAIASAATSSALVGRAATIRASNAVAGTSTVGAANGGSVTITGGDAKRLTSGHGKGGDVIVAPGLGTLATGDTCTSTADCIGGKFIVNSNSSSLPPNVSGYTVAGEIWNFQLGMPNNTPGGMGIDTFGTGNTIAFGVFDFRRANGTAASPTALKSGDLIGVIGGLGYGATGYSGGQAQIRWLAAENWSDTAQGEYFDFLATPAGSAGAAGVRNVARLTADQFVVRPPGGAIAFDGTSLFYSGGVNVGDVLTDPGKGYISVLNGQKFPTALARSGSIPNSTVFCDSIASPCVLTFKDSTGTYHALY
jgi:hypothetical protein